MVEPDYPLQQKKQTTNHSLTVELTFQSKTLLHNLDQDTLFVLLP